ncbi:LON peptidase substrate-binding domain-containing protein [Kiloniella majae]|uniref:LON peptidase substrate-binding domain-containing protein n=1 Tax=Kiloniella majae TaxID=1938558 RepID=UPI000A278274|nr:LON peptidase substrate-binding domain-containing protein [Kiloniella majae]
MTGGIFDPKFNELPSELPIFPLEGALLLPGGTLPLNVFEPRYLTMIDHALGQSRCIGMIQPNSKPAHGILDKDTLDQDILNDDKMPLYKVGCLGRITSFMETDDGRYLISLQGLIRYNVAEETPAEFGYRRVLPDYNPYRPDLENTESEDLDRARLLSCLRSYFDVNNIDADWKAIEHTNNHRLVNTLAMICPFSSAEKQAILEASTLIQRADIMETIMDMAVHQSNQNFAKQ